MLLTGNWGGFFCVLISIRGKIQIAHLTFAIYLAGWPRIPELSQTNESLQGQGTIIRQTWLGKCHLGPYVLSSLKFALRVATEVFGQSFQRFTSANKVGIIYGTININLPSLRSPLLWHCWRLHRFHRFRRDRCGWCNRRRPCTDDWRLNQVKTVKQMLQEISILRWWGFSIDSEQRFRLIQSMFQIF